MKNLWIVLIVGLILRVVLSLTTFHSDMAVFELAGKLVAGGNILNLYDFSSSSAVLNYPPAVYLYHGLFSLLFGILGLSSVTQFNLHWLLLKLPYLPFDLLTGFVLFKLFDDRIKSQAAFILWMFNPVSLYATYMMGQFDIIPTFFIVLSLYLVVRKKLKWAALAIGAGIAFKISPIFLVVPLVIFGKNFLERTKLLILALLPYLVSILPYLSSQTFRATALYASQSSKSLYAAIPVSGGESIILFPALLLVFYLIIWTAGQKMDIWKLYLIPILLFFIFTHFHPQWLIWLTPLLILEMVRSGFKNLLPYFLVFISWFASLFFFDPSLTLGIFAPLIPSLSNSPSIWTLLGVKVDYNLARSLIQTVFASGALYLIYQFAQKSIHV